MGPYAYSPMSSVHYHDSSQTYNMDYTGQKEVNHYQSIPILSMESSPVYMKNLHPPIIITQRETTRTKP